MYTGHRIRKDNTMQPLILFKPLNTPFTCDRENNITLATVEYAMHPLPRAPLSTPRLALHPSLLQPGCPRLQDTPLCPPFIIVARSLALVATRRLNDSDCRNLLFEYVVPRSPPSSLPPLSQPSPFRLGEGPIRFCLSLGFLRPILLLTFSTSLCSRSSLVFNNLQNALQW